MSRECRRCLFRSVIFSSSHMMSLSVFVVTMILISALLVFTYVLMHSLLALGGLGFKTQRKAKIPRIIERKKKQKML
jgi:ABC-type bacteriocin/lantibiotic exporter with double-glycine peptidase domain